MKDYQIILIIVGMFIIFILYKTNIINKIKIPNGGNTFGTFIKSIFKKEYAIPLFVYCGMMYSLAILFPDFWKKYWGNQEFFWISQGFLGMVILTSFTKNWWVKWPLRIAFGVILFSYSYNQWVLPDKMERKEIKNREKVTNRTMNLGASFGFDTRYISVSEFIPRKLLRLNVTLPPEEEVGIKIPSELWNGRLVATWSDEHGQNNVNRLYQIKINDDNSLVEKVGLLNKKMHTEHFDDNVIAYKVSFRSLMYDQRPTYLKVSIIK